MGSYGDKAVIARYANVSRPITPILGEWQHGWHPRDLGPVSPSIIVGTSGDASKRKCSYRQYLGNADHETQLRAADFRYVRTIGYPYIYTENQVSRIGGKVLVVPPHGLLEAPLDHSEVLEASIREAGYLPGDAMWMIHAADWKGEMHRSLVKNGWECAIGADPTSDSSLQSVRNIFDSSEKVIGFSLGSYVAYAAYSGCAVQILKDVNVPQVPVQKSIAYKGVSDEVRNQMSDRAHWFKSRWRFESMYGDFFQESRPRSDLKEWARWELGEVHKLEPSSVIKEFLWDVPKSTQRGLELKWEIQRRLWVMGWDTDLFGLHDQ
jgi:hypothetical protein